MHCSKFQEGANQNPKGGNPILNIGRANCQGGANQSQGRGAKAPPRPPEINPVDIATKLCLNKAIIMSSCKFSK